VLVCSAWAAEPRQTIPSSSSIDTASVGSLVEGEYMGRCRAEFATWKSSRVTTMPTIGVGGDVGEVGGSGGDQVEGLVELVAAAAPSSPDRSAWVDRLAFASTRRTRLGKITIQSTDFPHCFFGFR
jgi:hypothetical protein